MAKKAAKRARILDAARALFLERGFHGTAVPRIADEAGVGTGSIYRYFPSKDALVNAVYQDAKGRVAAAIGQVPSGPPRAAFDAVWQRLTTFARQDPTTFQFLELLDHTPYLDDASRAAAARTLAPLYAMVRDLQLAGSFRADLPAGTAMALVWGALVGVIKAERQGYLGPQDPHLHAVRDACWRACAASTTGD